MDEPSRQSRPRGVRQACIDPAADDAAVVGELRVADGNPSEADGERTRWGSLLRQRVLAVSLAALILYPFAVTLPVMTLSRFGHSTSTSILGGISMLWQDGHRVLAAIVAICSVVVPLGKLLGLLWLATAFERSAWRDRLLVALEITGRWGMLDVLLVAVLVAAVKLGEVVRIEPGVGALAFAACVGLAIVATATMGRLVGVARAAEAREVKS